MINILIICFSFSPFISYLCHFTIGTHLGQRLGNNQKDIKAVLCQQTKSMTSELVIKTKFFHRARA